MKTFKRILALALVAAALMMPAASIAQGSFYFWWQVIDERGEPFIGLNGVGTVQCSVYRANVHGHALLHANSSLSTALAQPIFSDQNGKLHFYSSISDPVDVNCVYSRGGISSVNKLDTGTHKLVIDRQGRRVVRFPVNNATTATNQSTGITIPQGAVIRDVIVQNLNPLGLATTYHLSVGFGGNHAVAANVDALVSILALNSPDEWLRPHMVCAASAGAPNASCARGSANHRGTALSFFHADITAGGSNSGISMYRENAYIVHVQSGLDVVYSVAVPGVSGGARAHVYIIFDQYHTGINRQGLRD